MILERFRLDGRAAVVTGAGRGIGAATALALAEAGADVCIAARTEGDLADVAARIEASGRTAHVVPADLSDLDAVGALADTAAAALGHLDIVVNNVGGSMPRPFGDTSVGYLERAFHFNVATAHALTRAALPHLVAAADAAASEGLVGGRGPAVVNISSAIGRLSGRGMVAYGTAKAALTHWTRMTAADLAPRIRVNAIAVGSVATSALQMVLDDDDMRAEMEATAALRRLGQPEDIAAGVVYLASPAGSYLTGKVLEIDGGLNRASLDIGIPDV
ncbi:MAG: SDR family oxidoreductase [Acidimicrobiales bacterium]